MEKTIKALAFSVTIIIIFSCSSPKQESDNHSGLYTEMYRPQYHFSPPEKWMNDPNGMVFYEGEYHLFYQYYPDSTIWGPMHWGHAISTDLVHWQHLPIALYPDSLGYIFSGSAVVDINNTSGFGNPENPPIVAIFTHHNPKLETLGQNNFQSQSLAYSLDKGRTWKKYEGNPVLPNPDLNDFRDPKVSWHSESGKWIMTLAAGDHVRFYSSIDLKEWAFESEFGKNTGAHGGVWECPDLFELPVENMEGQKKWALLVSINPGAPNGGSGTQYFVGSFDGHSFTNDNMKTNWIDYGTDNYAGVTWSNVENRRIFLGWMSNWTYANKVPTNPWRSAMTVPRELTLVYQEGEQLIRSKPIAELNQIMTPLINKKRANLDKEGITINFSKNELSVCVIEMNTLLENGEELVIEISNKLNQKVVLGYNSGLAQLYIDRTQAGRDDFHKAFTSKIHVAEIKKVEGKINLKLMLDKSSIEMFFADGLYVMTDLVFPEQEYNTLKIYLKSGEATLENLSISSVKPIWAKKFNK